MGEGGITRVRVECANCHQEIHINYGAPATIACQSCGSIHGYLFIEEGDGDAIALKCHLCKKIHPFAKNKKIELRCPDLKCHGGVLSISGSVEMSKVKINIDENKVVTEAKWDGPPITEAELKEQYRTVPVDKSLKIVIKYYDNNKLVERACRTWIYPEVVFALNDQGTIPPGFGVCHQFFSPRNSTQVTGGTKIKPFLRDLLQGLLDLFPNEDYYGLFNSDIILPLGYNIKDLIPRYGKPVSYFHRLMVTGSPSAPVKDLKKAYQEQWGKDGFVCEKNVLVDIINNFGDVLLGAPGWDDGLLIWLWERYGVGSVDIRWGEVWHAVHDLAWSYNDPDGVWNFKAMKRSSGLQNLFDWEGLYNAHVQTIRKQAEPKVKTVGIIQPGRVGDVCLCFPIAKWYYDRGYNVKWPVPTDCVSLFDYISYAEPIDIGMVGDFYQESLKVLKGTVDEVVDLGIGFGRDETKWLASKKPFNVWKYLEAKVPWTEKYNLVIDRNFKREAELRDKILKKYHIKDGIYSIFHSDSSWCHYNWKLKIDNLIEIEKLEGYTIFDWLTLLEGAQELFLVDSCFQNLVDMMKIGVGRRTTHFWGTYNNKDTFRGKLCQPKIAPDWKVQP
jgi:hypothetical protein